MKKGNILLHGIGKILFCMIGSVSIIGEMLFLKSQYLMFFSVLVNAYSCICYFSLRDCSVNSFRTSNFTYNHRYYSEIENKFKLTFILKI